MNPGVGIPVFAHDHCASLSNPRPECCRCGNWIPARAGHAYAATLLDIVRPSVRLMTDSAPDMMGGLAVDVRLEQFSTLLSEPCAERSLGGSRVLPGARHADTPAPLDHIRPRVAFVPFATPYRVLLLGAKPFWLQKGRAEFLQPGPEGSLGSQRCHASFTSGRGHVVDR